ncbi:MAG TPA: hypothetical protein VN969_47000 [Streptosporangiaceae bacterium]|jgi:dTMP kinase|nr:hypothetical protein [Streptosporangiaceae bacterium]
MKLPPFSSQYGGLFVSVDGPSGAGTSTIVRQLCRELTESVTGHALACLYAADRYHHVEAEIRGHLEAGEVVISDRYIPSGLAMQRFDGIDPAFLWQSSTLRLNGRTWPGSSAQVSLYVPAGLYFPSLSL